MQGREIAPNEQECMSQCILKFWSGSDKIDEDRDEQYEQCLTGCNICGTA